MKNDPFKEYFIQAEPDKRDKGYAWQTAIGLQAVDGLKTSKYLIDTAIRNIEGDISIDEAQELLNSYYEEIIKLLTNKKYLDNKSQKAFESSLKFDNLERYKQKIKLLDNIKTSVCIYFFTFKFFAF